MGHDHTPSRGALSTTWRKRAKFLSDFGDPNSARLWQLAAAELDEAQRRLGEETLTLVEAAALSGYTADHLGSLVRSGEIANYGRKRAPRVRRSDLPIKQPTSPGRPPATRQRPKAAGKHVHNITKLKPGRPH